MLNLRSVGLLLSFLLASVALFAGNSDEKKVYGEGLSGAENVAISEIVEHPEQYEGKLVQVEGKVTDVCKMMGCWMDIQNQEGDRIQIKVQDGVIVFPVEAVGKNAVAEGVLEIMDMTRDEYVGWLKHVAEENGREFDPDAVGKPPYKILRLRGKGAEIYQ